VAEVTISEAAHARPVDAVLDDLGVDPAQGLSDGEAARRRQHHGENRIRQAQQRRWWQVLLEQFRSVIVLLLLAAAVVALAFGEIPEAIAISVALVVDAVIGFVTEMRALRSMESLQQLEETTAFVRREGEEREIAAAALVPGDVVVLREGQVVPADVRLIDVAELQVDEAPLTGESVPVAKTVDPSDEDAALADRTSVAFKGTAVTRGQAVAVTVATGMATEIGHISELVEGAEAESTPLERRLDALGKRLIWLVFAMAAVVAVAGVVQGRDLLLVVETAIVLGVAAVPEGLPIVSSLALARGVRRMAHHNALVKRLSSVETLGSASIIMTDKTGTLTEGRMQVARLLAEDAEARDLDETDRAEAQRHDLDDPLLRQLVETAVLCTDADLEGSTGDPMELALLRLGEAVGADRGRLVEQRPQVDIAPFSRDTKMMATIHEDGDRGYIAVKGAPEAVLQASVRQAGTDGPSELTDDDRDRWSERNHGLAADGLRVLAVASRDGDGADDDPYDGLTLLGLVGLLDPPRRSAIEALEDCRRAGIRVIMVTGDQPPTAQAIARSVGIVAEDGGEVVVGADLRSPDELDEEERSTLREVAVFARVSPEEKLDLIGLHQSGGAVVGMTGDGVNDAPALQQADIGIAMGKRGTEVAREASDIVLLDDAFDTIVRAVRYGRAVFTNIRKFVIYLLSGNLAEILAVTVATVAGLPLPLLPLQILYINFVSDIFPALALGLGPPRDDVMDHPPRDPSEPIVRRRDWVEVGLWGVLIATTVLGGLLYALFVLDLPDDEVVTISFLAFGLARTWHTFNMRRGGSGLLRNEVTTNRYVWVAVAIGVGLMLLAALFSPLAGLLRVVAPTSRQWLVILAASLVPLVVGQIARSVQRP
jgi:P-type Ca2+ transporter type 2C